MLKNIHPNKRCPRCNEYNLRMAVNLRRFGKRYFLTCETPGCWYFGPEARTKNGAIRKWNEEAGKNGVL